MAFTTKVRGFAILAVCISLVLLGCRNSRDNDDPLINPNINAQIDNNNNNNNNNNTGTSGPGILTISPTAVNIPISEIMTFTAAGGIPPYVFTFADTANATFNAGNNTWTHTITGATLTGTGVFTAGPTVGMNQIRVTDQATSVSDATVNVISPTTGSYRIVSTNLTPYPTRITVPANTDVYFVIQNGTAPDSFNVTNNSGGQPRGFMMGTRVGCWRTGATGMDDGSICDILQVFDSSTPINVATLRIYVSFTPLAITPKDFVAPATTQVMLTASPGGVGTLTWSFSGGLPTGPSGGTIVPQTATTARYTAGGTTNGIFGTKDIIEVRDQFPVVPQIAQAQANVPGLSVYPKRTTMAPSTQKTLTALGGSGSYTWTNLSPSLVSIAPAAGTCTVNALASEGEATINLTDTAGGSVNVSLVVCGAVTSRVFTAPGTFYPSTGFMGSTSFYPMDMVVDDFDKNNVPDVAVTMSSSSTNPVPFGDSLGNQVSLLMGGATKGTFQQTAVHFQLSTAGSAGPWGIASGDYNGDSNRDLAVACMSGYVLVMLGDGTGGFPNSTSFPYIIVNLGGGFRASDIVTYNFDRSNGDDLAVCDSAGGKVAVLLSNGSSNSFTLKATLQVVDPITTDAFLPNCYGIAIGNFDNDTTPSSMPNRGNGLNGVGYVDIAVSDFYYDRIVIFDGQGLTTWNSSGTAFSVDPSPTVPSVGVQKPIGIAAGDIDGDGDADLVSANNQHYWQQSATVVEMGISVLVNNSGGTLNFSVARQYGPDRNIYPDWRACYFWSVLCHDFNNDGMDDVAALSRGIRIDPSHSDGWVSSQVCLWRGVGGGMIYGFSRNGTANDTYATSIFPAGTGADWDFHGAAFSAIDFAGHTRNNAGAPLMDIIVAAADPWTWDIYYGKMTLLMNNCD